MPLLVLSLLLCMQAALLAMTAIYAQAAASAAARSQAAHGAPPARRDLPVPPAWRAQARVRFTAGHARVTLRAPSVLPVGDRWLHVAAESPLSGSGARR